MFIFLYKYNFILKSAQSYFVNLENLLCVSPSEAQLNRPKQAELEPADHRDSEIKA